MLHWLHLILIYVLFTQSQLRNTKARQNSTVNELYQSGGEILKFSNRTNSNITSTDETAVNIDNNNGNQITNGDKEITYFDQLSPLHRKKIVVSFLDIDLKGVIRTDLL